MVIFSYCYSNDIIMANPASGAKLIQDHRAGTAGGDLAADEMTLKFLDRPGSPALAFRQYAGKTPGVVFLGGLRSTMESPKALIAEEAARARGLGFLRFDYSGHGASEGRFEDGTIGQWKQDTLDCLDRLTSGPQILIASSLGGWLALLAALERPERIKALLIVSCAADFTEHLHNHLLEASHRQEMEKNGYIALPSCRGGEPFIITQNLIEDARAHLILPRKHLAIDAPVHLLAGRQDQDVPWQTSHEIAARLPQGRATVEMVETARHQFDRAEDLEHLKAAVMTCLNGLA
jgi:pimeloyl-ACP methyl ester carboxylesterase